MRANFKRISKASKCELKKHYRGAHAEVVGILDKWAANDQERFVPARVVAIAARCKDRQTRKLYGKRWVEKILRDLRDHNIISARVKRWRDFHEVPGFLVADHKMLCCRMSNTGGKSVCIFMGWGGMAPFPQLQETSSPATAWPTYQPEDKPVESTGNAPGNWPVDKPGNQPGDGPVHRPQDALDSKGVEPKSGDLSFVTVMHPQEPFHPMEPAKPIKPAPPAKPAAAQEPKPKPGGLTTSQSSGACAPYGHDVDVTKPLGSSGVTIAQQFTIKDDMQLLTEISDGEFNVNAYKQTGDIDLLCEYVRMVVEEIAGMPWDNQRTTCAGIMDVVAKRINRAGKQYPKGWLLVLKELQKGGKCKAVEPYRPPQNPNWVGYQSHDGPPNERDVQAHIHSDFQLCDDWICRSEAGRAAEHFTVKNSVGAWTKP